MPTTVGDYTLFYKIGEGASAKVYFANKESTQEAVAVKVIQLPAEVDQRKTRADQILREVELMRALKHPSIIEFLDFFIIEDKIFVVMELAANGSLEYFVNGKPLSVQQALHYFTQITEAVEYLHNEVKIAHRDLKADNILLTDRYEIKLSDFGLGRFLPNENHGVMKTRCGSPCYVAPEVVTNQGYTEKTDIWSLGVLLYYMLTGHFPFFEENIQRLFKKILEDPIELPPFIDDDPGLRSLLEGMLCKNPEKRLTASEVLHHQWLTRLSSNKSSSLPYLDDNEKRKKIGAFKTFNGAANRKDSMVAAIIQRPRLKCNIPCLTPGRMIGSIPNTMNQKGRRKSVIEIAARAKTID